MVATGGRARPRVRQRPHAATHDRAGRYRQTTVPAGWQQTHHEAATRLTRQFFYTGYLAFSLADTTIFRDMMREIAACDATWRPPTREALRTRHLREEHACITRELSPIRHAWATYGCSILSDGWTDIRRRPIINILVSCPLGTVFLRGVDASRDGDVESGEFIYEHIRAAVIEVGAQHVVQVVTDNASNCVAMGELLERDYPAIVWTPCAAHCIDLLMHDIGGLPWVSTITSSAVFLVTFVTRKKRALAMFRRYSPLELKKPAATRFAYHFIVLERLLRVRPALRQMAASPEFTQWHRSSEPTGLRFQRIVFGDDFWRQAEQLVEVLGPVYHVLRLVDREGSTLGLIYEFMDRIGETLQRPFFDEHRYTFFVICLVHLFCESF